MCGPNRLPAPSLLHEMSGSEKILQYLIMVEKRPHICRKIPEKHGQTYEKCDLEFVWRFLGYFYGKDYWIDSRKAPGHYSGSIWAYNFSICFWEKQKSFIFMISGFPDPWEPLIYGFEYTNLFSKKYRKIWELCWQSFFRSQKFWKSKKGIWE